MNDPKVQGDLLVLRASFEINSTAGNARRERTAEILQAQWAEAGFEAVINFTEAGTLFGEWGP